LLLIKPPLLFISLLVLYMVPQLTLVLCVCLYYGCTLFPCQENSQGIPLTNFQLFNENSVFQILSLYTNTSYLCAHTHRV
jgi:hypothetical protein